ncbi:hypothetical protein C8A03DRAFT_48281 [Achaetomium macrosporum]|uniref:Uncharacterized protein n=1 Tax=Achaetomium macrosporum TaxID=79813 RepID=A0AAN7H673_9PEZI|nr:hypothetical protein C8A03DRAFT_48281 [Achaetomium macrosporum]
MGYSHHMTPTKAMIQGAVEFLEAKKIPHFKSDVFKQFGVSYPTGWRYLREPDSHGSRTYDSAFRTADLATIERFLESTGFDGRTVSARTVRRAVGSLDFRFCVACQKQWASQRLKERRVEYSRIMLEKYPEREDWRHIRFSDECHFGWGSEGRVYVLRRPWERYCPDCLVEYRAPDAKDIKRSPLVWYDSGNDNGKMNLKCYRDSIIEPVVGGWLRQNQFFVLEEDNDSGHGTSKKNIVGAWKERNGLEYFFNCAQSPDFSPIEKAWQSPKQAVSKRPCWEDDIVKQLAEEGWQGLAQESINNWIDQISQIFKGCLELDGAITGH